MQNLHLQDFKVSYSGPSSQVWKLDASDSETHVNVQVWDMYNLRNNIQENGGIWVPVHQIISTPSAISIS